MFRVVFVLNVIFLSSLTLVNYGDAAMNTGATILNDGFQFERHQVTTADGYILEMHRIPFARLQTAAGSGPRPVVFMMHGLTVASNVFVSAGPEFSVAYILADAGFDVWMGNHRGTKPSRYHATLDPDNSDDKMQFFDFSWEQVGTTDVPAMIDYVLEHTGRDQLHYIGHSQGGTVYLVMCSMRTEYNAKIASAHLFAGVGHMVHFPNTGLRTLAMLTDVIFAGARLAGLIEVFPPNTTAPLGRKITDDRNQDYCLGDPRYKFICKIVGPLRYNRNDDDDFLNNQLGGGSLKQVAHYGQNIRDNGLFRRWNYGSAALNEANYGTDEPPLFNLTLITANTTMHYSMNDTLLDERDVLAMEALMPNTVARRVSRLSFDHGEYVYAEDARELVTNFVIESILDVEKRIDNPEPETIEVTAPATEIPVIESAASPVFHSIMLVSIMFSINCLISTQLNPTIYL